MSDYKEKVEELTRRWEAVNLLRGVPEDKKHLMTVVLENQRKFNEGQNLPDVFRRLSIPIVRRLFQDSPPPNSRLGERPGNPTNTNINFNPESIQSPCRLSAEAEYTLQLVEDLRQWFTANKIAKFRAFGLVDGNIVVYGD